MTDEMGMFEFPGLEAIMYDLTVEKTGWVVTSGSGIQVEVELGMVSWANFTMSYVGPINTGSIYDGAINVPVDEPMLVSVVQRVGHRHHDPRRLPPGKSLPLHSQLEIIAANPLGDHVAAAVGSPADIIDGDNRGVVKSGDGPGLVQEALDAPGIGDLGGT